MSAIVMLQTLATTQRTTALSSNCWLKLIPKQITIPSTVHCLSLLQVMFKNHIIGVCFILRMIYNFLYSFQWPLYISKMHGPCRKRQLQCVVTDAYTRTAITILSSISTAVLRNLFLQSSCHLHMQLTVLWLVAEHYLLLSFKVFHPIILWLVAIISAWPRQAFMLRFYESLLTYFLLPPTIIYSARNSLLTTISCSLKSFTLFVTCCWLLFLLVLSYYSSYLFVTCYWLIFLLVLYSL
jgi:hypothetical protein